MNLFLDACAIIYWVEAVEPHYSNLLALIEDPKQVELDADLVVSRLSFLECRVKPLREKNKKILARYDNFFVNAGLEVIEVTAEIMDKATHLRANHRLRTPDAIQAACALSLRGKTRFLTRDHGFNRVLGLDFLMIP